MKTKKAIVCGLLNQARSAKVPLLILAIILFLSFAAYGDDADPGVGGSGDLQNWTAVADSTLSTISAIAYGSNRFVAVGWRGKMAYSANGASWTAVADSTFNDCSLFAIAYGNNRFVVGGEDGKMAYSYDGASWTAVSGITLGYNLRAIAYGNGRFVAVGRQMAYCDW